MKSMTKSSNNFSMIDFLVLCCVVIMALAFVFAPPWTTFNFLTALTGGNVLSQALSPNTLAWFVLTSIVVSVLVSLWALRDAYNRREATLGISLAGVLGLISASLLFVVAQNVNQQVGFWIILVGSVVLILQVFLPRTASVPSLDKTDLARQESNPGRRRITILMVFIGMLFILGILYLLVSGVKTLVKSGNGAPGTLLYATMFNDPNDPDWYQYQSALSAQINNNTLTLSADQSAPGGVYSPLNYTFADFDVRVDVQQTQMDDTDPYSEYGILFRYQDPRNYYMFKVRGDGYYHIERTINGASVDLSAPNVAPNFAPGNNRINDLRVVGIGDTFRFYLNGQLLTLCPKGNDKYSTWNGSQCMSNGGQTSQSLTDSTFGYGQIALGLYQNQSAVQVAFSNLVVYSPTPSK